MQIIVVTSDTALSPEKKEQIRREIELARETGIAVLDAGVRTDVINVDLRKSLIDVKILGEKKRG
ncbi:hypothetical protein [Bacillus swezeyi]|uniref:Uncharacterized protein n=1 Tax=Bacillus swezeyi TaxID=1925020 RepID=A0A5M8RH82_9BACI|nr:hypothetical protein [Bacillus swezeyi]KAA6447579.1 hypothetical protein DX927_20090 [Bacillus swezeyi]TYS34160.1 hypothetical protein FZC77_17095 [Bacillus swezeyi]